jgi:hypothetical protein
MKYTEYKEKKAELSIQAEDVIKSYFNDLFEAHPDLIAIRWNQYIPAFNDGDPCNFSLGTVYICDTEPSETEPDDYGDSYFEFNGEYYTMSSRYDDKYYEKPEYQWFRDLEDFLEDMDSELEDLFGSNATVIVFRTSIEIEEYDCGY